jgi:hypothetical protein
MANSDGESSDGDGQDKGHKQGGSTFDGKLVVITILESLPNLDSKVLV